jgi:O-antigen ligase
MAGDLPFRWPTDAVFIFLAIGMATLIAMSRDRVRAAVMAYILCLPTVDVPGTYYSGSRALALLVIAEIGMAAALALNFSEFKCHLKKIKRFIWLMAIFYAWCIISTASNGGGPMAWRAVSRLGGLLSASAILSLACSRRNILKTAGRTFVLQMVLISVIAAAQFIWGRFFWNIGRTVEPDYDYFIQVGSGLVRAPGLFQDPNNMGIFAAVGLMLLCSRMHFTDNRSNHRRRADLSATVILWTGLLCSLTRTAVGSLAIGLVSLPLRKSIRAAAALFLALALATTFMLRNPGRAPTDTSRMSLLGARPEYWRACLQMALKSPLVGVGLGRFGPELKKSESLLDNKTARLQSNRPHNIFLGLMAETGFVGVALFAAVLMSAGAPLAGKKDPLARTALTLLLMIVFYANMHNVVLQDLLWGCIGIAAALQEGARQV